MTESTAQWRRSSYCANGACVEMRRIPDAVMVRSTVTPETVLTFDRDAWRAFIATVKASS